ncbi:MAG: hypothetical protein MJK08_13845 [Campylobacterales bacterium]|nr:hypothetical protein [Campylobacterales bacterium]
MYKFIFIFILFFTHLYSTVIHFSENKYINALDITVSKEATLYFNKKDTILKYNNENKITIFNKNNIIIKRGEKIEILSHEDNMKLTLFFLLVNSIHYNNIDLLKNDFKIIQNNETILIPNNYISNIIINIKYTKKNNLLNKLTIYFVNKNRITIVPKN